MRIARKAEKMGTRRATPMPTILCPLVSSSSVRGASVVGFMVRLVLPVFKSSSYTRHAEYPRNIANSCVTVTVTRKEMPEYGTGDVP